MNNAYCLRRHAARARAAVSFVERSSVIRRGPAWLLIVPIILCSGRVRAADVQTGSAAPSSAPATTSAPPANTSGQAGPAAIGATRQQQSGPALLGASDQRQSETGYAGASPFGFGGVPYLSGFTGCATADTAGGGTFLDASLTSPLIRPEGPANNRGRYVDLSLDAAEIYTDNLTLSPDDPIEDFITDISPHLNACANTGRVRGSIDYRLQGLLYAENSSFDHVYNNVAAQTTIAVLPQHFYLDVDTTYGQAIIDPSFGYSRTLALRPDSNRTGQWTSNLSPYYIQSLGPVGRATLRYRYGKVIHGSSDVPDTTINAGYLDITSPPGQTPITWDANLTTQKVHRSGGNSSRFYNGFGNQFGNVNNPFVGNDSADTRYFDKATLQLGYQLTNTLRLLAEGGREDRYKSDGSNDRLGSTLYSGGIRWESAKNSLEARVGHRFFGTSYYLSAAHYGRSIDTSLDYRESPSSQGLNELNGNNINASTSFMRPSTSLFERGVFVEKRVTASADFHTAITRTTLRLYGQKRDYVGDTPNERYYGGDLRVDYQFWPRTAIVPVAGYEQSDTGNGGGMSNTADVGINLVRRIGPKTQAAIGYGHAWRTGDNSDRDYHENRVTLQFSKGF